MNTVPARRDIADSQGDALGSNWWKRPFSVFQTNLQEVDATLDVEKTLDFIQGYGADTWLINTGGIVSFYPTALPFQTRNPFLSARPSGDLIGDAVAAARSRGVRVIARCDFSKVATPIAKDHPEWLFVAPDGHFQIYNTLYSTCPNGEYYRERSLDIIDEIATRYPVDGFFFNWFNFSETDYSRVYHGVCHCNSCKTRFAAYSGGGELPDGPAHPQYPAWLRFSAEAIRGLGKLIADHIRSKRPNAALILGRGAPIVYHEANNAFGRELWQHETSEAVSSHVTGMPEVSLAANCVSFVDMPYRMAGEQPEHFAQYLLQAIARGGNPSTYIMGAPGRIPYANLPMGRSITKFFSAHMDLYRDLRPNARVALVRPDKLRSADPGYGRSVEEFRGLYRALTEVHIPFDVVKVELLGKMSAEGRLVRYQLLIIPDLGELGGATSEAVDGFVSDGGRVVLTGCSGLDGGGGAELRTGPAVIRNGRALSGTELWATYATDQEQPEADRYLYGAPVVPVFGEYCRHVWKPGAERRGSLLGPAPFGPPEKCYGQQISGDPAAVLYRPSGTDGGVVVVIPWTVGLTYREFGTTEVRDFFLRQISELLSSEIEVDLPPQVEVITGESGSSTVVHLINQTGALRRSFTSHVRVSDGSIRVKNRRGAAYAMVAGVQLSTRMDGDDLIVNLPSLELFEVVVIDGGEK